MLTFTLFLSRVAGTFYLLLRVMPAIFFSHGEKDEKSI